MGYIRLIPSISKVLGVVHTGGESLQEGLGDVQTCRMTLALAYVLRYLSSMWLQL